MGLKYVSVNDLDKYVYCPLMKSNVLMKRGIINKTNNIGDDIKDGIYLFVDKNQCLLLVSNGIIIDFTTHEGFYVFNQNNEYLLGYNEFSSQLIETYKKYYNPLFINDKIYAYYINTSHMENNRFGTSVPVPFKDNEFMLDTLLSFHGNYVIQIVNPLRLFYTYHLDRYNEYVINEQFKEIFLTDFLNAFKVALKNLSNQNISYDLIPGKNIEITKMVQDELDKTWGVYGLNVIGINIGAVGSISKDDIVLDTVEEDSIDMKCPYCGHLVNIDDNNCTYCGGEL